MAFNLKNHLKFRVPSPDTQSEENLSGLTEEEANTGLDLNLPPPGFVSFFDPPSNVKYGKIKAKKGKVTGKRRAKAQGLSLGGKGSGLGSRLLLPPSGGNKRVRLRLTELAPSSSAAESLICVGCTFCLPPSGGNKRVRHRLTELAPSSSAAESLICVGCTFCFMYIMVPVSDPKCPKCNSADCLINIPNPNPAKKARKN